MNWELFWTALAVLAVYQVVSFIRGAYFSWKMSRDYGDISKFIDKLSDDK